MQSRGSTGSAVSNRHSTAYQTRRSSLRGLLGKSEVEALMNQDFQILGFSDLKTTPLPRGCIAWSRRRKVRSPKKLINDYCLLINTKTPFDSAHGDNPTTTTTNYCLLKTAY